MIVYLATLLKRHATSPSLIPQSRVNPSLLAEVQALPRFIFSEMQVIQLYLISNYYDPKTLMFFAKHSTILVESGLIV